MHDDSKAHTVIMVCTPGKSTHRWLSTATSVQTHKDMAQNMYTLQHLTRFDKDKKDQLELHRNHFN